MSTTLFDLREAFLLTLLLIGGRSPALYIPLIDFFFDYHTSSDKSEDD
jgi:hypothetical protein